MQSRMKNPVVVLPDALKALMALDKAASIEGVPYVTRKLIHLRVSQINGCSVCTDMHARELKKAGQSDERLFAVAAWRDTPIFQRA
jgi:AhpD family alkylhydroperoxidase